jgi:transposase
MTTIAKYQRMRVILNEKQWRQYLATEAEERKNVAVVAREAGVSINTITRGRLEIAAGTSYTPGSRIRAKGAGPKRIIETDTELVKDLEALLEPKGDPMSLLQWTTKSLANLVVSLEEKHHTIKKSALANLLGKLGFSLKANKKNIEGVSHPDRDAQFQQIQETCETFENKGNPIISVDCKKKELIGNFKNNGSEWQPKGRNTTVNVYDFKSLADGKAAPYGVYDLIRNTGFVNVGVDHDTASFAVESIRRWWNTVGQPLYPDKKELLITSDGGGSNGVRNKLWKKELQQLADETNLSITVAHFPPATSKWNKIEHRLFSYISINWRGKPLTSLETIIELISHTTTAEGLTVTAVVDQNIYPTGVKVSDAEMASINIVRNDFHGDWNYVIRPRTPSDFSVK